MARGDVVGVAFFPELNDGPNVARLVVEGANGPEPSDDRVVWDPEREAWCEAREPATKAERARVRRGHMLPGTKLRKQPPQERATLPQEVIEVGVARKAARIAVALEAPREAAAYLENRVQVGAVSADFAHRIAAELGLTINTPAAADGGEG